MPPKPQQLLVVSRSLPGTSGAGVQEAARGQTTVVSSCRVQLPQQLAAVAAAARAVAAVGGGGVSAASVSSDAVAHQPAAQC
jgi:hypothetical protein